MVVFSKRVIEMSIHRLLELQIQLVSQASVATKPGCKARFMGMANITAELRGALIEEQRRVYPDKDTTL